MIKNGSRLQSQVCDTQVIVVRSAESLDDLCAGGAPMVPIGSIVLADHQTAGRGRLEHRWETPPGAALLVSFVLAPNPLLSLAAGVAAAEACNQGVRLKWPNDMLLRGRKVGGVLVEATPAKAVCGIGINLTWAPEGAALLNEPRDRVLERLLLAVDRWSSASAQDVIARWRELSDTIGRRVRVDLPDRTFEGDALDINERGELIVDGEAVSAGSVRHLPG